MVYILLQYLADTLLLVLAVHIRVYFIVPTKPLVHWPFPRQPAEQPEVSPEVIFKWGG